MYQLTPSAVPELSKGSEGTGLQESGVSRLSINSITSHRLEFGSVDRTTITLSSGSRNVPVRKAVER